MNKRRFNDGRKVHLPANEVELVYGVPVPGIEDELTVTDVMVIALCTNLETGDPIVVSVGSAGIQPWTAVGLLALELERHKTDAVAASYRDEDEDDE